MKRRAFLKTAGSVAGGYALGLDRALGAAGGEEKVNGMPRRVLGRTGQKISIVGFPGLALANYDQERGTKGIHDAFERGVNYYDVAPAYGNGDAEIKMGIGLQGIDRSKIFLSCKTKKRDKAGAREELERSLTRLKTNYFDLYQLHHLWNTEQVKQAFGPGGAMETLLKAKEEGKVKYLGFSAHTRKAALAAMKEFRFDTVMFPINFVEDYKIGFSEPVLKLANEQGAVGISIKSLSMGAWPQGAERKRKWWYKTTETQEEVDLAMRYTLSLKGVVTAIPPSFLDLLDKIIIAAKTYKPIKKDELAGLKKQAETCLSVFERQEQREARGELHGGPFYADSPHECCGMYA
ncbi:MAG: aldo/keto reductase [Planctomycetota bacterium]|jgi:predicted aldo/keto reductase-like oxidoreductase